MEKPSDSIIRSEAEALSRLFESRKRTTRGISQQGIADDMGISQGAVGHYLKGRNALNLGAARKFAEILQCRISDFSPRLEREFQGFISLAESRAYYNVDSAPEQPRTRHAPIINTIEAGTWGTAVDSYPVGIGEGYEAVPEGASQYSFWMRVRGDSMVSPIPGADSFPPGTLVHVDPEKDWESGDYVVAKIDESEEATFKQLVEDAGRKFLKPLNPTYDKIPINGNCRIVGKVTEYKRKL